MLRRFRRYFQRKQNQRDEAIAAARERMIQCDLRDRGIVSQKVLDCMASVSREAFVPAADKSIAYADRALPIACDQTISQPYMVALMTELLDVMPEHHVLEIGTGSGYQTAILAKLAHDVVTIERHGELSRSAQRTLADQGFRNVEFIIGDGSLGWPRGAPYGRMLVTAAAAEVPQALIEQLGDGGRLVIPIGERNQQQLQVIERKGKELISRQGTTCRFVPLVGEQGFAAE